MEDKRINEIEEIENTEVDEATNGFESGAMLAGAIGGFLAYAAISGAKKLKVIIEEKLAAKKLAKADKTVIEVDCEPVNDEDSTEKKTKK